MEVAVEDSTVPLIDVLLAPANVTVIGVRKPLPLMVMGCPGDTVDGVMAEIVTPPTANVPTYWVKCVTSADAVRPELSTMAVNSVCWYLRVAGSKISNGIRVPGSRSALSGN